MENRWNLCVTDPSRTSRFAAEEFARLLGRMDPSAQICLSEGRFDGSRALRIGLDEDLPKPPPVPDPEADDAVYLSVRDCAGRITGSNARSVLIGVYRFFREAGCVFVRPGREGEYVPRRNSADLAVHVCEAAAYRYRGICLEGSNSFENAAEMVDLAPKLGFNAYFTQLFRPAFAFTRWYAHANNPYLVPTPVSGETIDAFVGDLDEMAALRGLTHHRIGHGWASRVLGVTSGAWHEPNREEEIRPDRRRLIALLNGERKLFSGSAIDTNLCYSDPETQDLLVREVVSWARAHPETRYLHFWLADQPNNQCECPACRDRRPSDLYVGLLNRIDEALTAEGLDTKIVFLIYLDLLWAPETARLKNPDRFILMYAPIRRSYSVPMHTDQNHEEAPFKRNGFVLTRSAGGTLPYLRAWQRVFPGDSFIFDYPYMWDWLTDPGGYRSVRILAEDAAHLRTLGLDGMMSCQNQRVFLPSGFGMHVLGHTLWTGQADFDGDAAAYFPAAFGDGADAARAYLSGLSERFDPETLRGEKPVRTPEAAARYAALPAYIDAFLPVIERNRSAADPVQARSWEVLAFHAALCRRLAAVLYEAAAGTPETMDAAWAAAHDFACAHELRFRREFDVFELLNVWENQILPRFRKEAARNTGA